MQYNQIEIAKRIRAEREALGWSQEDFGLKFCKDGEKERNRNTISAWENDKGKGRIPPLKDMLRMCELFDCELGYLLGEHACKTREATDVQEVTGLSAEAVKNLRSIMQDYDKQTDLDMFCGKMLNEILISNFFKKFIVSAARFQFAEYQRANTLMARIPLHDGKNPDADSFYALAEEAQKTITDTCEKVQKDFSEKMRGRQYEMFDFDADGYQLVSRMELRHAGYRESCEESMRDMLGLALRRPEDESDKTEREAEAKREQIEEWLCHEESRKFSQICE